jgi:hypothetical protein
VRLRHGVKGDHDVGALCDVDLSVVGLPGSELMRAIEGQVDVIASHADTTIGGPENRGAIAAGESCPPEYSAPRGTLVQIGVGPKNPHVVRIDRLD